MRIVSKSLTYAIEYIILEVLPAERKPITGDAFRYLKRGTIPIVEQRNINKSFPRGFKDPSCPPLSIGLSKSGVTATGFAAACCADNLGR